MDKSERDKKPYRPEGDDGVFPSDIFPEDVFPESVFPSDIFPRRQPNAGNKNDRPK